MKHLIFIGLMGSGKTTLGKKMASHLNMKFIDTDELIVAMENQTISEIFNNKGESYFRDLEKQILVDLQNLNEPMVISTGGGLPCFNSNMEVLNQMGFTVYLKLSPGLLAQRLMHAKIKRPIIEGLNQAEVTEKLSTILIEREHVYLMSKCVLNLEEQNVKNINLCYQTFLNNL
jgi:shikimate kinase